MILRAGVLAVCGTAALIVQWHSLRTGAAAVGAGWAGVSGAPVTIAGLGVTLLRGGAIFLCAGAVLVIAGFIGGRLVRVAVRRRVSFGAGVPMLAGYAGLSLIVFGVAAVGLCRRDVVLALAAAGLIAALPRAVRGIRTWAGAWTAGGRSEILLACLAGAAGLMLLPRFLVPETFGDGMQYHLLFPQQLLLRHRFPEPPLHESWGYPLFAELPSVIALALGPDTSVKVVMAALGLGPVLGLVRMLVPGLGVVRTVTLAALAIAVPTHAWVVGTVKNDVAAIGFVVGALLVVCTAERRSGVGPGRAVVAGFLLGGALASKPVLVPIAGCLAAWAVVRARRRVVCAGWMAAGVLVPVLPWAARDLIQSMTPFYGFGALGGSDARGWEFVGWFTGLRGTWMIQVHDAAPALCLIPWWIVRRRIDAGGIVAIALASTLLMTLGWPGGRTHLDRYAYAGSILLNAVALAGFVRGVHDLPAVRGGRVIAGFGWTGALVCTVLLFARAQPWTRWHDPGRVGRTAAYLVGAMPPEAYRRSMLGSYGEILPAMERETAGSVRGRMLAVGGNYYWDAPVPLVFSCEPGPFVRSAVAESRTAERVGVRFRQLGVRWILYDSDYGGWERGTWFARPWTGARLARYAEYLGTRSEVVAVTPCRTPGYGIHWLLRVDPRPAARRRPVDVMPGIDETFRAAGWLASRGRMPEARKEFEAIHRVIPDVTMVKSIFGHFLVMNGDPARGLPMVRDAAARGYASCLEPADIATAIALHNLGRREEALDAYERALEIHALWPVTPLPALDPGVAARRHRRAVAAADRAAGAPQ